MAAERMFTGNHLKYFKIKSHDEINGMRKDLVKTKLYAETGGALALAIGWAHIEPLPEKERTEITAEEFQEDSGWTTTIRNNIYIKCQKIVVYVTEINYNRLANYAGVGTYQFLGGEAEKYVPASKTVLIYGEELLTAYGIFIATIERRLSVVDKDNRFVLMAAVLPLVVFPGVGNAIEGFRNAYEEDIEMINATATRTKPGEEKTKDAGIANFIADFALDVGISLTKGAVHMSRYECVALGVLHAIAMSKTGPLEHFRMAIEKRMTSLRMALKLKDLDVKRFMADRYNYETCRLIYENMSLYPMLIAHIYSEILAQNNPMSAYMRIILSEAQFTTFNLIFLFVNAENLTMLHTLPEVVNEFATYQEAFQVLVTKYGQGWPYCKLINPEEAIANATKFPNLSRAGKAFALVRPEFCKTIVNLQGVRGTAERYIKWAAKILPKKDHPGHATNLAYMKSQLAIIRPTGDLTALTEEIYAGLVEEADNGEVPSYVRDALDMSQNAGSSNTK